MRGPVPSMVAAAALLLAGPVFGNPAERPPVPPPKPPAVNPIRNMIPGEPGKPGEDPTYERLKAKREAQQADAKVRELEKQVAEARAEWFERENLLDRAEMSPDLRADLAYDTFKGELATEEVLGALGARAQAQKREVERLEKALKKARAERERAYRAAGWKPPARKAAGATPAGKTPGPKTVGTTPPGKKASAPAAGPAGGAGAKAGDRELTPGQRKVVESADEAQRVLDSIPTPGDVAAPAPPAPRDAKTPQAPANGEQKTPPAPAPSKGEKSAYDLATEAQEILKGIPTD